MALFGKLDPKHFDPKNVLGPFSDAVNSLPRIPKNYNGATPDSLLSGLALPDVSGGFASGNGKGSSWDFNDGNITEQDIISALNDWRGSGLSESTSALINYLLNEFTAQRNRDFQSYQNDLAYKRQRYETDLAYDRTKFATLYNQYLAAGLSPAAALQAAAGQSADTSGSAPSAASGAQGGSSASPGFSAENLGLGVADSLMSFGSSVASMIQSKNMFDVSNIGNAQIGEGIQYLNSVLPSFMDLYDSGVEIPRDALLSRQDFHKWSLSQPSDSPVGKFVSSVPYKNMMRSVSGQQAWNQFLVGDNNPFGWYGYTSQNAEDQHFLDYGNKLLLDVNYDTLFEQLQRFTTENDDWFKIHDLITEDTAQRLKFSNWQYQQYNMYDYKSKWRNNLLQDLDLHKANIGLGLLRAKMIHDGYDFSSRMGWKDALNLSSALQYVGCPSIVSNIAVGSAGIQGMLLKGVKFAKSDISSLIDHVDNSAPSLLQYLIDFTAPVHENLIKNPVEYLYNGFKSQLRRWDESVKDPNSFFYMP